MITRRQGLQVAGLSAFSYSRVAGANGRISGALVGCGTRGVKRLLETSLTYPDVEMVAACDVYAPNLDGALSTIAASGTKAKGYGDYRDVVAREDIDVVFVATPDHWHAPITIAACEAGKDVYVEKPLANSISDCLAVVDAAAKTGRIVQVGVQQRSMRVYLDAFRMISEGEIGPVKRCTMVWGGDGSGSRERDPEVAPPDGLNWEMFQGRAPRRPYQLSRQRSWRSYWEYGSGVITDFGVHLLDVMHWFMGIDEPALCFGAGYHSPARQPEQVPDVVSLTWQYDQFLGTYSSQRGLWGNTFWGEKGTLHVNRSMIRLRIKDSGGKEKETVIASPNARGQAHIRNFLDCVKSRKRPNADAETGCRSTIPCLLAGRSVRTGKAYYFDWPSRSVVEV